MKTGSPGGVVLPTWRRELAVVLALSGTTLREALRSPFLLVVVLLFAALIAVSREITLFGFGAEQTMVKEMGLASLRLFGLTVVLVFGTGLIPRDREEGQLLFLRAGPVSWGSYLGGRYLGLLGAVLIPSLALCGVFALVLVTAVDVGWAETLPLGLGAALAGVEVMVLAAAALLFSTLLPRLFAWLTVVGLFLVGHLESWWAARLEDGGLGLVATLAGLPIPDLQGLDRTRELAGGTPVSLEYLVMAAAFGLLYLAAYLVLARAVVESWELQGG